MSVRKMEKKEKSRGIVIYKIVQLIDGIHTQRRMDRETGYNTIIAISQ